MNIHISGMGNIGPGEYEHVGISGSASLQGPIRCAGFSCTGSSNGNGGLDCTGTLKVCGSSNFGGDVRADSLKVLGALSCDGTVRCGEADVKGSVVAGGDFEAETVDVSGKLDCAGLLNAEEIRIRFSEGRRMKLGSIGGGKIRIRKGPAGLLRRGASCVVQVQDAIEGDEIDLDYVHAARVSGRVVTVGEHCEIGLVQYSEQAEIHPAAKVGKVEKVL